jgi:hypothetical protein
VHIASLYIHLDTPTLSLLKGLGLRVLFAARMREKQISLRQLSDACLTLVRKTSDK